jgi:hypothetical protein
MNRTLYLPSSRELRPSATSTCATTPAPDCVGRPGVLRLIIISGVVVAAAWVLAGCGKKQSKASAPISDAAADAAAAAPTSPAASAVNPEAPPEAQEKARVAQAVAMRSGKAPPPPAMQLRGGEPATPEVLAAYNQQLAQLIFRSRDVPETLEEIVRRWPMPRLPTPPPGKQIVYYGRYHIIQLDPP